MEIPSTLFSVAVVPFITLIVQIVKTAIPVFNPKYSPVVALVCGLAFSFGHAFSTGQIDYVTAAVWGLFYGLSAVGAYSGVKNVTQAVRQ